MQLLLALNMHWDIQMMFGVIATRKYTLVNKGAAIVGQVIWPQIHLRGLRAQWETATEVRCLH